jgi:hypothetical protein
MKRIYQVPRALLLLLLKPRRIAIGVHTKHTSRSAERATIAFFLSFPIIMQHAGVYWRETPAG